MDKQVHQHHSPDHDHGHEHSDSDGHMHPHSHDHSHSHQHNHPHDHLHSHVHGDSGSERRAELQTLATQFVQGFRKAKDKTSYLRLANIDFQQKGKDGLTMHLVDAKITSNWQIGTASPAFASRELVYMPFPGDMVDERESMTFTYVSLTGREDIDLISILNKNFKKQ